MAQEETEARLSVVNVREWLTANENSFSPPVCNKLMHNSQLIVMFVGGPNQREDYHIEEGEELFYQLCGDMCVKVLENGAHKNVVIREGELFLLPARVPHSPQRTANSIGLVIERRRLGTELDGVRWFVPSTTQPLYEKWFHCKDLGVELVPLIRDYLASNEYRTKVPSSNVLEASAMPFELSKTSLDKRMHGAFDLFERIESGGNVVGLTPPQLRLQFEVLVLRKGVHTYPGSPDLDVWLWQLSGRSELAVKCGGDSSHAYSLAEQDSVLVPANFCSDLILTVYGENGAVLKVSQDPKLKA